MTPNQTPTRYSTPVKILTVFVGLWAVLFGTLIIVLGPILESPQWDYLFEVWGGRWTWGGAFLFSAAMILGGCRTYWNGDPTVPKFDARLSGSGCALFGTLSLIIMSLFSVAPLLERGTLTMGPYFALFVAAVAFGGAATHWSDREW